jgi:hypothetical protein
VDIIRKVYQEVTDVKYLGSIITSDNNCERDTEVRMAAGNQCYYTLTKIMKSRAISTSIRLKIYRTIIRSIIMYGYEGWTISEHTEEALRVWDRKTLRKVYGPERDTSGWRIRTNKELQDKYRSADIVTSIKARRLEWAGHVVRMDDERMVKSVFLGNPGGRRKPGRPRLRWLDCVEDDLKTLGVRRWRKRAEDREE